jgi:hypothetical protein
MKIELDEAGYLILKTLAKEDNKPEEKFLGDILSAVDTKRHIRWSRKNNSFVRGKCPRLLCGEKNNFLAKDVAD